MAAILSRGEVREWMSNYIPRFYKDVFTSTWRDLSDV